MERRQRNTISWSVETIENKERREIGVRNMQVEILLGGLKVIMHTLEYLKETGRLD
jgi:hypothetical protein